MAFIDETPVAFIDGKNFPGRDGARGITTPNEPIQLRS
jgi:hypothetical protein